jgi:hypothetical protein
MMMPHPGSREVDDPLDIVRAIFERNIEASEEVEATFTSSKRRKSIKIAHKIPSRSRKPRGRNARKPQPAGVDLPGRSGRYELPGLTVGPELF